MSFRGGGSKLKARNEDWPEQRVVLGKLLLSLSERDQNERY
jgi:hypothetical protein